MKHALPAAALLLAGIATAQSAFAQAGSTIPDPNIPDPNIPCGAFARSAAGGWTVTAPAMLDFKGLLISFTVGTRFAPGGTSHGLAMPVILDRECGNVPARPMRR